MFFDLHAHPSLKSFLTNGKVNCWHYVNTGLLSDLASQCSLSQMNNGRVKIVVAALHPVERPFCAPHFLKTGLPYFSLLDGAFLRKMERKKISYYALLKAELAHMEQSENYNNQSFQFVNSFEDISDDKANLVLSVEGGHAFIDTSSNNHNEICKDLLKNFREFKKLPHRLLFVTMTHLSQGMLCTHSFGMKMLLMFRDKRFYPKGSGLTDCGKEFIREALSTQNGKRILIDIKHMSLRTRKEFYDMRKEEFPDVPIVASHMGIAGCSIYKIPIHSVIFKAKLFSFMKERQKYKVKYYKLPGLFNTYFNPAMINLYDEEITEIVESSGLIGVSMDKRILGYGGGAKDFYSFDEFNNYYKDFIEKHRLIKTREKIDINKEDDFDEEEQYAIYDKGPLDPQHQFKYVCNNIVHIVKVGGEKAWDCICLGSDFDGLIDGIDPVPNVASYYNLEKALIDLLPEFIKEAGIPMPADIEKTVKKIVYENGYEFLRRNFK
ncbi:MAG: membrane dipeptidase [Cytophagaceae bacterium]